MDTEYETKVLDIDVTSIIGRLRELKAQESPEELMRRYVFDYDSPNAEFMRLRAYKRKITLTYKSKDLSNTNVGNTKEIEVEVSDFDKTAEILKKLPFKRIFYQENKRHMFEFNDIEFTIDTWPKLKPYLEIEAKDKGGLQKGLKLLNLEGKDVGDIDVKSLYKDAGIDLHSFKEIKF